MRRFKCSNCNEINDSINWDQVTADELNLFTTDITSINDMYKTGFWYCPNCKNESTKNQIEEVYLDEFIKEYSYETNKIYKHTKSGNLYLLLSEAKETTNAKSVIIYQALYEDNQIWVRDTEEFFGEVILNGKSVPRFQKVNIERLPNIY